MMRPVVLLVALGLSALRAGAQAPSFAPVIREAERAVVHVAATARRSEGQPRTLEDLFRGPELRRGMGSGFVISSDGEIVTNAHVVEGATDVEVRLADDRVVRARIVGVDPMTDIALLRIDPPGPLSTLPLGDSDAVAVGDWVIAIGNPFGLDRTATAGIVSAKGRFIGAGPYDDFIQTDAAINPGNSGGPLLDQRGRVVGVNSAIVSPAGGNVGIGFAIPANLVQWVITRLHADGKVIRGWLGVAVQPVTPELARAFDLEQPRGALVADVTGGAPAARAGMRRGDVIVRFGDEAVDESRELPSMVAATRPGTRVPVIVLRDGDEVELEVRVGEMPSSEAAAGPEERRR